ncbi:MAG: hypothetical protein ACTTJS_00815 [Wolinella sp.]
MSEQHTEISNELFLAELVKKRESLQKCQESRALDSCLKCQSVLGCETRQAYVKAVYESMSKGQTGNFEF